METTNGDSTMDEIFFTPVENPDSFLQVTVSSQDVDPARLRPIPTEISQLILSYTPDAVSLRNLALSSATFYRSFLAAQDLILNDVLLNEFSPYVLPDALATLFSGRIVPHNRDEIEGFLNGYTHTATTAPERWTLLDALELSRIHQNVDYFATDFVSSLTMHPIAGSPLEGPIVLSRNELDRIHSALYRFQLYCNCFCIDKEQREDRSADRPDSSKRKGMFFDKFSPWEDEQLASIYEYLFRKLSKAFDEVAEHDVEWGERNIRFYDNSGAPHNHHQEHYLSLGLGYSKKLVVAQTYDERYQLLSSRLNWDDDFMWPALCEQYDDDTNRPLGLLTEEERDQSLIPPFADDLDKGPAEAWRWAYANHSLPYIYFANEQSQLRQRGYVFFDLERLRQWNMFHEPFRPTQKIDLEAIRARRKEMMESWDKRSKIWQKGGRGWWSKEDSSKIIWIRSGAGEFGNWKVKSGPREKFLISQPGEPGRYQNLAD